MTTADGDALILLCVFVVGAVIFLVSAVWIARHKARGFLVWLIECLDNREGLLALTERCLMIETRLREAVVPYCIYAKTERRWHYCDRCPLQTVRTNLEADICTLYKEYSK